MFEYQNLFTTVQPVGPVHHGVELGHGNSPRSGEPLIVHLLGRIGNIHGGSRHRKSRVYRGTTKVDAPDHGIQFTLIG